MNFSSLPACRDTKKHHRPFASAPPTLRYTFIRKFQPRGKAANFRFIEISYRNFKFYFPPWNSACSRQTDSRHGFLYVRIGESFLCWLRIERNRTFRKKRKCTPTFFRGNISRINPSLGQLRLCGVEKESSSFFNVLPAFLRQQLARHSLFRSFWERSQ